MSFKVNITKEDAENVLRNNKLVNAYVFQSSGGFILLIKVDEIYMESVLITQEQLDDLKTGINPKRFLDIINGN